MALNPVPRQPLDYCGIRCTPASLIEIEDGRVAVTIQKADIQRISLRHGIQAPNPAVQIMFGLVLMSVAYFPVHHLIEWIRHGGTLPMFYDWLAVVAGLGAWLVIDAFKKGYFLEVQCAQGAKRLAFSKRPEGEALTEFIATIELQYNLRVARDA